MAIKREGQGSHPNVGFYPEEGKYNRTACTRCYRQIHGQQEGRLMGRCPCRRADQGGGEGQSEHAGRLPGAATSRPPAALSAPHSPGRDHRHGASATRAPIPLQCSRRWKELMADRTEIEVLVEADLAELKAEPEDNRGHRCLSEGKGGGGAGRRGEVRGDIPAGKDEGAGKPEVDIRLLRRGVGVSGVGCIA